MVPGTSVGQREWRLLSDSAIVGASRIAIASPITHARNIRIECICSGYGLSSINDGPSPIAAFRTIRVRDIADESGRAIIADTTGNRRSKHVYRMTGLAVVALAGLGLILGLAGCCSMV